MENPPEIAGFVVNSLNEDDKLMIKNICFC